MDPRLFAHYSRELRFVRELGAEFARRFPKVAGRLGLSELECADPHVERLLQGFALLSGRLSQQLDAEYPALPRGVIERVCSSLIAPIPAMTVAQFEVDPSRRSLGNGYVVARDTVLRTRSSAAAPDCEFRTAHAVQLFPIELQAAEYTSALHDLTNIRVPGNEPPRALLRLRLRARNSSFQDLGIDQLPFFIAGDDVISARLHEQLIACARLVIVRWGSGLKRQHATSTSWPSVRPLGYDDEHALLPVTGPTYRGHRLLQEYFAQPSRFDFVELTGLRTAMERCASDQVELLVPLTRFEPALENVVDARRLLLFATPAINLFPRACARISLRTSARSFKLEPDRGRSDHYEVHSIQNVRAHGTDRRDTHELTPRSWLRPHEDDHSWHYAIERRSRPFAPDPRRQRFADYVPSDVYLNLNGPGLSKSSMRELAVHALCTNGAVPARMTAGSELVLQSGAPAEAVRCVVAPSAPQNATVEGELAWSLLSRLSANYLALDQQTGGVDALRELLTLHAQLSNPRMIRHAESVRALESKQVVGAMPVSGPNVFARGLQLALELDEGAQAGHRVFTLASVLSELFARHATPHSFTQTVLSTTQRGEVYRWPAKLGVRPLL